MTPGNYSTHAIEHLTKLAEWMVSKGINHDAGYVKSLALGLARAEKFMIPEGGYFSPEMDWEGMTLENLRLPFKEVVLEFHIDAVHSRVDVLPGQTSCSKRIIYCKEYEHGQSYFVTTVDYIDKEQQWNPCPVGFEIRYDSKIETQLKPPPDADEHLIQYLKDKKKVFTVKTQTYEMMPWFLGRLAQSMGVTKDVLRSHSSTEVVSDWNIFLDFLQILNCTNVITEVVTASAPLNKKRARSGKLPFFDYRVLKIVPRTTRKVYEGSTPSGVRQGQHVRRGHIRHYQSGKNIWIDDYAAGDPSVGIIIKDYQLARKVGIVK